MFCSVSLWIHDELPLAPRRDWAPTSFDSAAFRRILLSRCVRSVLCVLAVDVMELNDEFEPRGRDMPGLASGSSISASGAASNNWRLR